MSRIEAQIAEMGLPPSVAAEVHAVCVRRAVALRAQLARVKSPAAQQRCTAAARALLDAEVLGVINRRPARSVQQ